MLPEPWGLMGNADHVEGIEANHTGHLAKLPYVVGTVTGCVQPD
jgi:hypothetical protein